MSHKTLRNPICVPFTKKEDIRFPRNPLTQTLLYAEERQTVGPGVGEYELGFTLMLQKSRVLLVRSRPSGEIQGVKGEAVVAYR